MTIPQGSISVPVDPFTWEDVCAALLQARITKRRQCIAVSEDGRAFVSTKMKEEDLSDGFIVIRKELYRVVIIINPP